MNRTDKWTLDEAAEQAAGNWRSFECFAWFRQNKLAKPDDWAILYTHHRDSGLIDQSNGAIICKELEQFSKGSKADVVFESHRHWAVGYIDGFSLRVIKRGRITKAFRKWFDLQDQIDRYPLLDESDYSDREYNATLQNLPLMAWGLQKVFDLPEGWEAQVYDWLSMNNDMAIENVDDQGGCPNEDALKQAFEALGYARAA